MPKSKSVTFDRILGQFGATAISIGGIIGSGIFFIIGIAAGVAGPALVLSLVLAGLIAILTALSFASMSSKIPKEGGEYQFVYHAFGTKIGFLTGVFWTLTTAIGGVTASLALASYFYALVPVLPPNIVAPAIIAAFILTDILGLKFSSKVNNSFVLIKISVLLLFIALTLPALNLSNFNNFFATGKEGLLAGAFLMFFAYAGFGKITAAAEEVKTPKKIIPTAIVTGIAVSTILYLIIGTLSVGSVGAGRLSSPTFANAPLAYVLNDLGYPWGFLIISIGAIVATGNVVLIQILGISRNIFAMSRNRQLPRVLSELHPKYKSPYKAELAIGILMVVAAFFLNIKFVVEITSFGILLYYSVINLAAFSMAKRKGWFEPHEMLHILGFVLCMALIAFYLFNSSFVQNTLGLFTA